MTRVVLVAPDSGFERQAQLLLGDEVVTVAPAEPEAVLARLQRLGTHPQLVVFGPHMPRAHAFAVADSIRRVVPTLALIADGGELPGDAVAAGIVEHVALDASLEDIDMLFVRAAQTAASSQRVARPQRTGRGRVIVVTSPKGGVGKTTVATNAALALAAEKPGEVVIVDADLQFGDVATVLDLEPSRTIVDALAPAAARDSLLVRKALTPHRAGLSVLAAPPDPAAGDRVTAPQLTHLLRQLAVEFAAVVLDTSPGLGEIALAALEEADALVLVTTTDVASVRGVAHELAVLRELDLVPGEPIVVLNQVESASRGRIADVEHGLGVPVSVVVPRSRQVALGNDRGAPVLLSRPRDRAAERLRQVAWRADPTTSRRRRRSAGKERS